VPHAELHFVPFAALMNRANGRFMVSRWDISYAPSASVWLRLRENAHKRGSKVLALAPRPDALPFSIAEVNGIKRIYGRSATVLTGAAASKQALRAALPGVGVVHFATLGVLNKHNPLFSFVDLGSGAGQRDRLEVHEAFGLNLRGQLIVLSACQTGLASGALADVPAGDDWMGLVQAFLSAGAGAVVASLWSVEDRATAELMTRFHRSLEAGRGDVKALAEAQRATLSTPRTAHPFYWAAFTVNGPGALE
jgi:CHAT domain-containing protein